MSLATSFDATSFDATAAVEESEDNTTLGAFGFGGFYQWRGAQGGGHENRQKEWSSQNQFLQRYRRLIPSAREWR